MAEDCLFCKIAAREIPSAQVYSDDEFYASRDIHPAAPSHVLLIPRNHIPSLLDIAPENAALIGRMFIAANRIAEQEGIARDGFRHIINCGPAAGQEVPHIHLHILGGRQFGWPPG